jgi:hypothetical protein
MSAKKVTPFSIVLFLLASWYNAKLRFSLTFITKVGEKKNLSVLSYRPFLVQSFALHLCGGANIRHCTLIFCFFLSHSHSQIKIFLPFYLPFCGHSLIDLAFRLKFFLSIIRTLHRLLSFKEIIWSPIDQRTKYRNGCDRKQGLF